MVTVRAATASSVVVPRPCDANSRERRTFALAPRGVRALALLLAAMVAVPAFAASGGQPPFLAIFFALVMAAPTAWFMYRAYQHCRFDIVAVTNDNSEAVAQFVQAVEHAEVELLIHDDGDKVDGSVYDDRSAIQAVRDRLNERPGLRMRCLLNYNENVEMAKLKDEFEDRFRVRYLHQRPVDDVHFKIADHGKWAYLSTHRKGDTVRNGKVCDGTHANERVRRAYVGGYLEAFDEGFAKAHER